MHILSAKHGGGSMVLRECSSGCGEGPEDIRQLKRQNADSVQYAESRLNPHGSLQSVIQRNEKIGRGGGIRVYARRLRFRMKLGQPWCASISFY